MRRELNDCQLNNMQNKHYLDTEKSSSRLNIWNNNGSFNELMDPLVAIINQSLEPYKEKTIDDQNCLFIYFLGFQRFVLNSTNFFPILGQSMALRQRSECNTKLSAVLFVFSTLKSPSTL